jgi:hypothetical protein
MKSRIGRTMLLLIYTFQEHSRAGGNSHSGRRASALPMRSVRSDVVDAEQVEAMGDERLTHSSKVGTVSNSLFSRATILASVPLRWHFRG